jgi:hypothetical protein
MSRMTGDSIERAPSLSLVSIKIEESRYRHSTESCERVRHRLAYSAAEDRSFNIDLEYDRSKKYSGESPYRPAHSSATSYVG